MEAGPMASVEPWGGWERNQREARSQSCSCSPPAQRQDQDKLIPAAAHTETLSNDCWSLEQNLGSVPTNHLMEKEN